MKKQGCNVKLHNYVSNEYVQMFCVNKIKWNAEKAQYEITTYIENVTYVFNRLWTIIEIEA